MNYALPKILVETRNYPTGTPYGERVSTFFFKGRGDPAPTPSLLKGYIPKLIVVEHNKVNFYGFVQAV
jgi:hypothetical protein